MEDLEQFKNVTVGTFTKTIAFSLHYSTIANINYCGILSPSHLEAESGAEQTEYLPPPHFGQMELVRERNASRKEILNLKSLLK